MPDWTTGEGDAELDRWLAAQLADLIRDLTAALDLDAGLRDVTLPAQHSALVADLGRVLDLDAGLAAILPAPTPLAAPSRPLPDTKPEPADGDLASDSVDCILYWLAGMSDGHRLAIRNALWLDYFEAQLAAVACVHEICSIHDLAPAPDLAYALYRTRAALTRARARARDLAHALDRDLVLGRALARARARALDLARALERELTRALDDLDLALNFAGGVARVLELTGDSALTRALELVNVLARDLSRLLSRRRDVGHARVLVDAQDLASDLFTFTMGSTRVTDFDGVRLERVRIRLEAVRHDYAGADLRDVDLTGLDLRGVRWSDATQWPPGWEGTIRAGSVQLGDGVYEFRPGGGTHHASVLACT